MQCIGTGTHQGAVVKSSDSSELSTNTPQRAAPTRALHWHQVLTRPSLSRSRMCMRSPIFSSTASSSVSMRCRIPLTLSERRLAGTISCSCSGRSTCQQGACNGQTGGETVPGHGTTLDEWFLSLQCTDSAGCPCFEHCFLYGVVKWRSCLPNYASYPSTVAARGFQSSQTKRQEVPC